MYHAFDYHEKAQKQACILGLIGGINLPIIKFSVEWWNTLHQPASLLRFDGPTIDATMLPPLLWMMLGFSFLGGLFVIMRARSLTMQRLIQK